MPALQCWQCCNHELLQVLPRSACQPLKARTQLHHSWAQLWRQTLCWGWRSACDEMIVDWMTPGDVETPWKTLGRPLESQQAGVQRVPSSVTKHARGMWPLGSWLASDCRAVRTG